MFLLFVLGVFLFVLALATLCVLCAPQSLLDGPGHAHRQ